jgi:cysteine-rich repeat protein
MFSTTVTEAGTLELAYRDSSYDDNSGEVSATITVETEVACVCGDESVNNEEQCDDGNDIDDDTCTNACTTPRCGDYIVQEGEECENSMMYSKVSESM